MKNCDCVSGRRKIITILCVLFILFANVSLCEEVAASMKYPFKPLLDAEWKETRPGHQLPVPVLFWNYYISPLFPVQWPPKNDQRYYYYVYAMGNSQNLVDGSYISAPWGRVEISKKGNIPPKFMRLSSELTYIGIQGVRPIRQAEASIYKNKDAAETYLGTLSSVPKENDKRIRVLRDYYCTWNRHNGVISEGIRKHHTKFFVWLGCK